MPSAPVARAMAVLLLTDDVTNTGVIDPPAFERASSRSTTCASSVSHRHRRQLADAWKERHQIGEG
jgi:hypothetical protein